MLCQQAGNIRRIEISLFAEAAFREQFRSEIGEFFAQPMLEGCRKTALSAAHNLSREHSSQRLSQDILFLEPFHLQRWWELPDPGEERLRCDDESKGEHVSERLYIDSPLDAAGDEDSFQF